MGLWPGTQRTWEKEEAKGRNWIFLLSAAPAWGYWGGGGSAPFGQLWWPQIQPGTVCISPELACLGTRAAEQLPEKGKADTLRALGVRAGMLKSKLRVACSLLLS